jgi:hypothetical protein
MLLLLITEIVHTEFHAKLSFYALSIEVRNQIRGPKDTYLSLTGL